MEKAPHSQLAGSSNTATYMGGSIVLLSDGNRIDAGTEEGVDLLEKFLKKKDFEELEATMEQLGFELVDGSGFQPSDAMRKQRAKAPDAILEQHTALSEEDEKLRKLFIDNGMPEPYHPKTFPQVVLPAMNSSEFKQAVVATTKYLADPNDLRMAEVFDAVSSLWGDHQNGDPMGLLFAVFRESIQEINRDKAYFLEKLQVLNKISEAVSQYIGRLAEYSRELAEKSKDTDEAHKVTHDIKVETWDTKNLDKNGEAILLESKTETVNSMALADTIKAAEVVKTDIRNDRDIVKTSFQNFDSKSNQFMNLFASLLKTLNQKRMGPLGNFL